MADDFDDKMNALLGRMNAWKTTKSNPPSPMPAAGGSSSSQDNAQLHDSSAGVTVVTSGLKGFLPSTPDFQTRAEFPPRRSNSSKYPVARDESEQGTSIDSYRDDFSIRVSDFQPRKSAAPRASVGALEVLRDVFSSGGGDGGDARDEESSRYSPSISKLEEMPEQRTTIAFEPASSSEPSADASLGFQQPLSITAPGATRFNIWVGSTTPASGSHQTPTGSISAPTGSISPDPGNSISSAPGGPAASGSAAFDNQMSALESKMMAWRRRNSGLTAPLSPVVDSRPSLTLSASANAPQSSLDTQNGFIPPQPEPSTAVPASAPAPSASTPSPTKKRQPSTSTVGKLFAAAQQRRSEPVVSDVPKWSAAQQERSASLEAPARRSASLEALARAPATMPNPVAAMFGSARPQTVPLSSMRSASADSRGLDRRQDVASQSMAELVPDQVWESKAPAHATTYAFLTGLSSTRTAYSYADTVLASPTSPTSPSMQEAAAPFHQQVPNMNSSLRSGYSSLNSSTSAPAYRTPPPEGLSDLIDSQVVRKSQVAGSDPLSRRVTSLEDSMQNIERLLRYFVKENPEVRDAVRLRKSRAKFLTSAESGALEALQSTLGAEPEHEPTWLSEQSQRSKMRASLRASSEDSPVHAALRPPAGKRTERISRRLDSDAGLASLEAVEATSTHEQSKEKEFDDPDTPVRRGRFHWPLDIHRARDELRDEVRKELAARWQ